MGQGGSFTLGPSEEPCGRPLGIIALEDGGLGHLSPDSHPHWLKVAPERVHTCTQSHSLSLTHTHTYARTHTHLPGCAAIYPSKLPWYLRKNEREKGRWLGWDFCLPTKSRMQLQANSDGSRGCRIGPQQNLLGRHWGHRSGQLCGTARWGSAATATDSARVSSR